VAAALSAAALLFVYKLQLRSTATSTTEIAASPAQQTSEQLPSGATPTLLTTSENQPLPAAATSPAPSSTPLAYSPRTQAMLRTLTEILKSRNDNDPRLDRDFRNLSPEDKTALHVKYDQLPAEDRNGKGTIVFVLGREIKDSADLNFIKGVMNEQPCMSLADCKKDTRPANGPDTHQDTSIEVTLAYPQMVSLYALDNLLQSSSATPALREEALHLVQEAKNSPIAPIRRKANDIESRLKKS
jgi:hypothetical protein